MDKNVVLARKYGRAIYEIAAEQNSLEKTGEELHLIADTITGNAELKQLLFHPLLAKDFKKDTLNKLFADKVQPVVHEAEGRLGVDWWFYRPSRRSPDRWIRG